MSDPDQLRRLALAAIRRTQHLEGRGVAYPRQAAPEVRRNSTVVGVLDDGRELAPLDQLAPFAAELELVARVVDRPGAVRRHQDAVLDPRNHGVEIGVA